MAKRNPPLDLASLTSEVATPMPEAVQRAPQTTSVGVAHFRPAMEPSLPLSPPSAPQTHPQAVEAEGEGTDSRRTENLEGLSFKVPVEFRKRFRQRAAECDIKLNELLFQCLDAWEEKRAAGK